MNFPSFLILAGLLCAILPPGYLAYIGAPATLVVATLALLLYSWRERGAFATPPALAILTALLLLIGTLPFVHHGAQYLLGPVMMLPMLTPIALTLLAVPAKRVPGASGFATICLAAVLVAFVGGATEIYFGGVDRAGLGNNPIHYGSLAAMTGGLSIIGVVASSSRWRLVFFLGPILGLGATVYSGSRGPLVGSLAMSVISLILLLAWYWRDRQIRFAVLASGLVSVAVLAAVFTSGNARVALLVDRAFAIFRFTGGSDDIRTALYSSAVAAFREAPIFGHGLDHLMIKAQEMFPMREQVHYLDNLHADWANFAVMAGSMGLFAYFLVLAAPLLLLRRPAARQDRPIVLGVVLLTTGQLTLGVSNAMFGILPQTLLYAVMLGYFMIRTRRLENRRPEDV